MSISVNPILPVVATQGAVVATQGAAPELVLQPGTVVDAQVLKLLSDNMVRIAIANLSIDVLSEIPLSAGQTLQLAVSEMDGGIRLAVVGQGAAAGTPSDIVTLAPDALINAAAKPSVAAAGNQLTPLERLAVSAAVQTAAPQQGSLSHLFANLGAVAGGLPPKLQQAVMQVLAQQTSLDQNLTGADIKNAFQKSGLFLEASLASGSVSSAAGMPDLKAALIVLRQTLVSTFGTAGTAQSSAALASSPHVAATVRHREMAAACWYGGRRRHCADLSALPPTIMRCRFAAESPAAPPEAGRTQRQPRTWHPGLLRRARSGRRCSLPRYR